MIKVILSYRRAIIITRIAHTDWEATPLRLRLWESCGIDGRLHLAGWSLLGTLRAYRSKRGHRSSKSGWWWCLQSSHWPRSSPGPGRNWSTYWGLDERTVCEQAFIYLPPQHDLLDQQKSRGQPNQNKQFTVIPDGTIEIAANPFGDARRTEADHAPDSRSISSNTPWPQPRFNQS